jgi:hypothetical protein
MARLFEGRKVVIDIVGEKGATAREVEEQAQEIVNAARNKASEFLRNYAGDRDEVLDSINYRMFKGPDGPYAVVGIRDRGELETWMVGKEAKEQWFSKILTEIRR